MGSMSLNVFTDNVFNPEDAEKVTNEHIKNLSKLLGINHFDPICEAFNFDRNISLNLLDSNDSNYNATYEQLLSGWKSGKKLNDLDELLKESGIRLTSSYKKNNQQ
ncbi:uncharacterized protein LOC105437093 [Strongylocentrotus purpuratus]|uniref:Uncharacterized protein n=1 Tax=Strongylocentrotus purpuratus TaxID=7668 RepID=A0A7M7T0J1_STRPU|nr:uncharacterized protein LOC105437093 [Strongylocentrotus purpuratus]